MILNNKKFLPALVSVLVFFAFVLPILSLADGLVPCGDAPVVTDGKITGGCDVNSFITLINNIINWIIGIAGVIFTITAIYAGFLYMTSGDDSGKKGKARDMLVNTLVGFVIILVSWLIVYTIIKNVVPDTDEQNLIMKFIKP